MEGPNVKKGQWIVAGLCFFMGFTNDQDMFGFTVLLTMTVVLVNALTYEVEHGA